MPIQRIIKKEQTYEVNGVKYFILPAHVYVYTNIYCDLEKNDIGTLKFIARELGINSSNSDKIRLVETILDSKCLVLSQDPPDPTRQYDPVNPLHASTYCPDYHYAYYVEQNKIVKANNGKQPNVNNNKNIDNVPQDVPIIRARHRSISPPRVRNVVEEVWEDYDPTLWEK
jgi:hypothetical protein